jgi:hypothetical protein
VGHALTTLFAPWRGAAALALAVAAVAWPALAGPPTVLHYTARLHGVPLLGATFCLQLGATSYRAGFSARTLGLAEVIAHARSDAGVAGMITGTTINPTAYAEHGRLSGKEHWVAIGYRGGNPVLQTLTPPPDDRLPIPAADTAGAVDGLSALALESFVATRTGACQGEALVYDGFQLRRATTRTGGRDVLAATPHSVFAGPALRCETESVMRGGYLKSQPIPPQQKPRFSKVWLAPVTHGGPDLPVRLVFDADLLGDIVVDIDSVTQGESPICRGAP